MRYNALKILAKGLTGNKGWEPVWREPAPKPNYGVVIVGGMGSIPGAALGARLIGLAEQFGSVYMPTYAVVLTFLIMVLVLAFRPQGLLSRR